MQFFLSSTAQTFSLENICCFWKKLKSTRSFVIICCFWKKLESTLSLLTMREILNLNGIGELV